MITGEHCIKHEPELVTPDMISDSSHRHHRLCHLTQLEASGDRMEGWSGIGVECDGDGRGKRLFVCVFESRGTQAVHLRHALEPIWYASGYWRQGD